jgi:hypothetical protein
MADFAQWAVAAEPGLGLESGSFLAAYDQNRVLANELALEASLLAQELLELPDGTVLTDTPAKLLDQLGAIAGTDVTPKKEWPKDGTRFGGALRRLAPNLRAVGIDVTFGSKKVDGKGRRNITIRIIRKSSVDSVDSVDPTFKTPPSVDASSAPVDASDGPEKEGFRAQVDAVDAVDADLQSYSNYSDLNKSDDGLLSLEPSEPTEPEDPEDGGAAEDIPEVDEGVDSDVEGEL